MSHVSIGGAETGAPSKSATADGLPAPRRYWSVATLWLAMAMAALDGVIANIALPAIANDLGATPLD